MILDKKLEEAKNVLISTTEDLLKNGGYVSQERMSEEYSLVNDIENYPHAFVIAYLMNRQITDAKACQIPYQISKALGRFDFDYLYEHKNEVKKIIVQKKLHRHHGAMAEFCVKAIERIKQQYDGNASNIWANKPSSSLIVYRFLEFDGIGQKIATVATNILVRNYQVPVSDKYSIDLSIDRHVARVFPRIGFIDENNATNDKIIFRARSLNPEYPGIFDLALFHIGHSFCLPQDPKCGECKLNGICKYSLN